MKQADLDFVLGPGPGSALERAAASPQRFVRDQDHLAPERPGATGRVLTTLEAFKAYGLHVLVEALETGAAILPPSLDEPAHTLKVRRSDLGLSERAVAQRAGVTERTVRAAETPSSRLPIRDVERIARALGLDERVIGFVPGAEADTALGVRLRTLSSSGRALPPTTVAGLAEAAWVIHRQAELAAGLGERSERRALCQPSSNYGSRGYPAWLHGFWLADNTRKLLGLSADAPILRLRELVESLGIPVVQDELPRSFGGATVSNRGTRGIVLNTTGLNENVWVRRATLAHELGHLLWDPDQELEALRVDQYTLLEHAPWRVSDHVEARANAFAIQFLAPQQVVSKLVERGADGTVDVRPVMEMFGISATAARYHAWNALGREPDFERVRASDSQPTDEWRAGETATVDYFPIESTPDSRRGRFSYMVARGIGSSLHSTDSAASMLNASRAEMERASADLVALDGVVVS